MLMLYCRRPQPIKERCHPLGHTHCVGLCIHNIPIGSRRQEWYDHQRLTRKRGSRDAHGTETLSGRGVSAARRRCPGVMRATRASISVARETTTSSGEIHSGRTTTISGSRPKWMSLTKSRTFLSSGLGWEKYGVTNGVTQSTWMWVCGDYRQSASGGLTPSSKVERILRRAWGFMLAPASRRVNISGNPGMLESGAVAATLAMVLLVYVTCASFGTDRKVGVPHVWVGVGGEAGVSSVWYGSRGNIWFPCRLVPVGIAWRAYVGARLKRGRRPRPPLG